MKKIKKSTKVRENKKRLKAEIEVLIKKAEEQNKVLTKLMETNKKNKN